MITISEFLKDKKNQEVVLEKIIADLRISGEWGKRGLYTKIGEKISLSPAYVGQVLAGNKALTENFLKKISEYLEVTPDSLTCHDLDFFNTYFRTLKDFIELFKLAPEHTRLTIVEALSMSLDSIDGVVKHFPGEFSADEILKIDRIVAETNEIIKKFCADNPEYDYFCS